MTKVAPRPGVLTLFRSLVWLLATFGILLSSAAAMDASSIKKFHDAVHIGDVAGIKSMLSAEPTIATSVDEYKFQPIHFLDVYFGEEILNLLLANGADINARNDKGVTLLHIITDPDAVTILVRKGADIEARDMRGWTPLIEQATNQQNGPDVVVALLANGAKPNAKGNKGESALSLARQRRDDELVRILIDAGAKD